MLDLRSALKNLNSKADWTGVRFVSEDARHLVVRDENIDSNVQETNQGVMIEVLVDGQFAYSATSDLTSDGLQRAYQKAMSLAEISKQWKLTAFTEAERPKVTGSYVTPVERAFDDLSLQGFVSTLIESSKKMNVSDEIINRLVYGVNSKTTTRFVSSNGSEFDQNFSQNLLILSATAKRGAEVQTRTNGMDTAQMGLEFFNADKLLPESERLAKEAIELLSAENCPTDTRDLLLSPSQLYLQVHESIGHPLEIDRILGDERNYAGWSFINLEDFGKLQYGSELLNVTFDPTIATELASYQFDDTGAKAEKQYIIKDGKLLRGLGSLESQKRAKIEGVSCARATSWNRPPLDRMANLNIEPGASSLDDMIASIEKGILMDTNTSWSIDDYRNKFQFGCEKGTLIENGKLTKLVKNPNYRGVCTPFWNSLKAVGDGSTHEVWGSYYCGKAEPNQVIRVGHATPYCLFSDIEVFGGAE